MDPVRLRQWLSKYQNPESVYRDITSAVNHYQGLQPQQENYTFVDGTTMELVNLTGTIPVNYRGSTYNIPICIWLIDTHPKNAPICYVRPTADMSVKVSMFVDQNGKIYLPYLHDWVPNGSDLLGLIQVLIVTFGEQPPVFARPKTDNNPPYPSYPSKPPGFGGPPYPTSTPYPPASVVPGGYPPYPPSSNAFPSFPPYPNSPFPAYPPTSNFGMPNPPVGTGTIKEIILYNNAVEDLEGLEKAEMENVDRRQFQRGAPLAFGNVSDAQFIKMFRLNKEMVRDLIKTVTPLVQFPVVRPRLRLSVEVKDEHIRESLMTAIEEKLVRKMKEQFMQNQAELQTLKKTQDELKQGKTKLDVMLSRLDKEQKDLDKNITVLKDKEQELNTAIEKIGNQESIDVDDAVTTTAPLYKQLLNAFAEEAALEDAIYYMGEALRCSVIDLDVFLRQVRALSRKQFMLRALMQKCRQKAGLSV